MSRSDYAAELKDLNERATMLRQAAKQSASVEIMVQLAFRLASAERAAARAILLFRPEGVQ